MDDHTNAKTALAAGKQNQSSSNSTSTNVNSSSAKGQQQSAAQNAPSPGGATQAPGNVPASATASTSYKREFPEDLTPWGKPVDIMLVADEMKSLVAKHCVLSEPEIDAIVLWAIASYDIDTFRVFPKLSLISPEKRCGKTTTLEVIMALCHNAFITANTSPAILYRISDLFRPTLLIDECDTFIKGGDASLIGIINSGHTKSGATVTRCGGDNYDPRAYSTWMPMVLASIGKLPDTVMDRSVIINLRRKKAKEYVDRVPADIGEKCIDIRRQVLRWRTDLRDKILRSTAEPDNVGNDRAVDNWSPLYAVAECISPAWASSCDRSYRTLTVAQEPELQTELLRDIRETFQTYTDNRIPSQELVKLLCKNPDWVWRQCKNGGPLDPREMAKMLAPYGIKPKPNRKGDKTVRGYERNQFDDAFDRYLDRGEHLE